MSKLPQGNQGRTARVTVMTMPSRPKMNNQMVEVKPEIPDGKS
jgi:hypothetical protein